MKRRALLYCFGWLAAAACQKDKAPKSEGASDTLPPLVLRDDTEGIVLSWIDAKGHVHTAFKPSEVPDHGKSMVRVVSEKGGQGETLYVTDLRHKKSDGSYIVSTMPRNKWEQEIENRRKANSAKSAPHAGQQPAGGNPTVNAIVYGAAWCQPCHQATAWLKTKGVAVVEYDIEREPARATEMHQKLRRSGRRGGSIPVIDLAGEIFVGFNQRNLSRALDRLRFRQERR